MQIKSIPTLSQQRKHTHRNLKTKHSRWLSARGISKQLSRQQLRDRYHAAMIRDIFYMPLRGIRASLRDKPKAPIAEAYHMQKGPQAMSTKAAKRSIFARLVRRIATGKRA